MLRENVEIVRRRKSTHEHHVNNMEAVQLHQMKYSQTIGQPQAHKWLTSPSKVNQGNINFTIPSQPRAQIYTTPQIVQPLAQKRVVAQQLAPQQVFK